jgi:hypothetical protein
MTDIELIDKILKSNKPSDIFKGDWKSYYSRYSRLIHPDICTHPKASDAMATLNAYKTLLMSGEKFTDEVGDFYVFDDKIEYTITDKNRRLINKSVENYSKLKSRGDKASHNFHRYMPVDMVINRDKLIIVLTDRAVPLTQKTLEQVHVNWIFSRMFEYTLWLREAGYSHLGLNPTSVFVVPETHGIIVTTYYHMTPLNSRAETVSAKYKSWYPTTLYSKKIATPDIDLELAKKIAIYLLGDRSAGGTKLKMDKTSINQNILNFLLIKHENKLEEYTKYRELLKKNFESKFYVLNL